MPRIRTSRTRPPPEGFEDIEEILEEYETKTVSYTHLTLPTICSV